MENMGGWVPPYILFSILSHDYSSCYLQLTVQLCFTVVYSRRLRRAALTAERCAFTVVYLWIAALTADSRVF